MQEGGAGVVLGVGAKLVRPQRIGEGAGAG